MQEDVRVKGLGTEHCSLKGESSVISVLGASGQRHSYLKT